MSLHDILDEPSRRRVMPWTKWIPLPVSVTISLAVARVARPPPKKSRCQDVVLVPVVSSSSGFARFDYPWSLPEGTDSSTLATLCD